MQLMPEGAGVKFWVRFGCNKCGYYFATHALVGGHGAIQMNALSECVLIPRGESDHLCKRPCPGAQNGTTGNLGSMTDRTEMKAGKRYWVSTPEITTLVECHEDGRVQETHTMALCLTGKSARGQPFTELIRNLRALYGEDLWVEDLP